MSTERTDRYLSAWGRNAWALLASLFLGASAVGAVEDAGWISTTGWHTAWVTAVLFLSFLAWKDVRAEDANRQAETLDR